MVRIQHWVPGVVGCKVCQSHLGYIMFLLLWASYDQNVPQDTCPRPPWHEHRLRGRFLQQASGGLVKRDDAQDVDGEILLDVGTDDVLDKGIGFGDGGVGNDNVKVMDAVLLLEFLDSVEGVLLDGGIVLDDGQVTPLAPWAGRTAPWPLGGSGREQRR